MNADTERRLLWHGFLLLVLALASGLLAQKAVNPRLVLGGHITGTVAGVILMALSFAWPKLSLAPGQRLGLFWSALYGCYGVWAANIAGGLLGTSLVTPVASAGMHAAAVPEMLVAGWLVSASLAMVAMCALALYGLRAKP